MRLLLSAFALLLALLPFRAQSQEAPPLQQQMTASEFKATGLDKLTPAELAALNAWLGRKIEEHTQTNVAKASEKAREEGRQEVVQKNRGFFDFGSKEPIVSAIRGEFSGFAKGRTYPLDNDQLWEQVDAAELVGVRKSSPKVSISPGFMGVWWMKVEGYNTQAKVRRIK